MWLSPAALALLAPVASTDPAPVEVSGWPFEVATFGEGEVAYLNRDYVWENVPRELAGWKFTRLNGGLSSRLAATPQADGELFLATAKGSLHLPGWTLVPEWRFNYTDANRTMLHVFRKPCKPGETVGIPQGNWTGGILLAPVMTGEAVEPKPDAPGLSGVVIDHTPASSRNYIGCPSIAVMPDGSYVASHSFFGSGPLRGQTHVFASTDRGATWEKVAEHEQHFANLFVHRGKLYLMGTGTGSSVVIRRSDDGGRTWTTPADGKTGLLLKGPGYHCAPVPVVVHRGRVWRAMEDSKAGGGWPKHFRALMMSTPEDADLLDASNWTCTNRIPRTDDWPDREYFGWLEGNAVVAPDGGIVNILRIDSFIGGKAALIRVSDDGKTSTFDPATGFLDFPGGAKKFTIRHDPESKLYWSLTNLIDEKTRGGRTAGMIRNNLALTASPDLVNWEVRDLILTHPDPVHHGFQYVDWQFDTVAGGDHDDIAAVSRTAFDDGIGGAHSHHDANYFTFHRVEGFRRRGEK